MNDLKQQLQEEISEALKSGISQNKLADQIGVSAATLINVRRGEWDNISDQMTMKLRAYFRINDWKTYETTNMKAIMELCQDASINKKFVAVCGYTGAGKTTALRRYSSKNADAWYVLGTTIMTQKSFLTAVLRSMGISEGQSIQDKMSLIVKEMNQNNRSLLIIDDAGKLNDNIMRLIQIIYDETESNAGMILAGTEYLADYISRGAILDKRGFRELKRRIAFWQPVFKPTKGEIAHICQDYGILDSKAIVYIQNEFKNFGDIKNIVTNAVEAMQKRNVQITREVLEDLHVGNHFYKTVTA